MFSTAVTKAKLKTYSKAKRNLGDTAGHVVKRKRVDVSQETDDTLPYTTYDTAEEHSSLPVYDQLSEGPYSGDVPIFSDDKLASTTPPSSPPPLLPETDMSHSSNTSENVANTSCRAVLGHISSNAQKCTVFTTKVQPTVQRPKQRLVQMQLNLGLTSQKTCQQCGMTYVPSLAEDARLHTRYHEQSVNGVEMGKAIRKKYESTMIWRGGEDDVIVRVEFPETLRISKQIWTVLEVMRKELGAVDIPEKELRETIYIPTQWDDPPGTVEDFLKTTMRLGRNYGWLPCARHRLFMYLSGTKCVGLCLVESISRAHKVEPSPADGASDGPLVVEEGLTPAIIGVSRIWTAAGQRRKAVASRLLDSLVSLRLDGREPISKETIAFSQPTNSGANLARRWFGKQHGWLVYRD